MGTPLAQRLGFAADARVVIFHADDLGMCHGSNQAFLELASAGILTCGSVMTPCPWAAEMIQLCAARPDLDVGVHLALTSEWPQYRWGPLARRAPADGLCDAKYCFWPTVAEVEAHADPVAAEAELRVQIERMTAAGVRITHLDTHMGANATALLADVYLRLGVDYGVPIFLPGRGMPSPADHHRRLRDAMIAAGLPPVDFMRGTLLYSPTPPDAPTEAAYDAVIRGLEPGVTFFSLHPNMPGDIEVIDPRSAAWRIFEYRYFQSTHLANLLAQEDIHPIGFRAIYDLVRRERAATSTAEDHA